LEQGKASVIAVQTLVSARYRWRLGFAAKYFSTISVICLNVTLPGMQNYVRPVCKFTTHGDMWVAKTPITKPSQ